MSTVRSTPGLPIASHEFEKIAIAKKSHRMNLRKSQSQKNRIARILRKSQSQFYSIRLSYTVYTLIKKSQLQKNRIAFFSKIAIAKKSHRSFGGKSQWQNGCDAMRLEALVFNERKKVLQTMLYYILFFFQNICFHVYTDINMEKE